MFCACGPSSFTGTTRLTTRTRLSHHGFSNNHSNGRAYMNFVTSVDSNVNYNSCMLVLQCLGNDNQNRVIFRTSQAKPRCGLVYRYHSGDGWSISCLPLMDFGGNDDGGGRNDDYGGNGRRPFGGGGNADGNEHPFVLLFLLFRLASDSPGAVILRRRVLLAVASLLGCFCWFEGGAAFARHVASLDDGVEEGREGIWEVRGGRRVRLVPNETKDEFVVSPESSASFVSLNSFPFASFWFRFRDIIIQVMLPEGFPNSVTSDYLDYSLWRGVQSIASQISSVLATQSLLYAVGLGKGAIPTAAAINWVLKDGIGYLSKIFLSKYGRHFDVHPKGWRLFADVLENGAFGLEMLTPAFPQYFVIIGAVAGAGRSAASLIQAATRSCFYAGFAAQRNFAEVIAKGEAQGMVSKSIGIMLGIALANQIGSSTPLTLASFLVLTGVHMYCNLESYKCILIRTLNPYRASLVFSEYLLSGQVPPVKEVNDEEPLFPAFPFLNMNPERNGQLAVLSADAKEAAVEIERRLQLGSKLSTIISNREDAQALFDLYRNEGYILTEHKGKYCVILKESSSPQDMLKSLFHVNYLYWLESIAGIKSRGAHDDSRPGGRLQISLEYVQREFNHAKYDGESAGWTTDALIARPLPNRIRQVMSP